MIRLRGTASTQLLIVGVAHLSAAVPDAAIARGRELLRAWRPDLIGIEALPGHLVVEYEERGGAFAGLTVGGAPDARAGAAAVAGERPWNLWQARRVATDPQSSLTDRVLGWLLAREPTNALLLPWREADLPGSAHALLARLEASPSEVVRLGVAIAKDFGHRELLHFDDHAGLGLLDHLSEDRADRYAAMAARLREASGLIPGGRLLAVVGSSHVRPLQAALSVDQHDLALVDIATVESLASGR
jgi:hypothetical protein